MHVKDARRFCDMGQFEHAGFAERDLGVVVTGLPTHFHGGRENSKLLVAVSYLLDWYFNCTRVAILTRASCSRNCTSGLFLKTSGS